MSKKTKQNFKVGNSKIKENEIMILKPIQPILNVKKEDEWTVH